MSESDLASTCALPAILVEPEVLRGGDLEEDLEDLEDCLCRKFATNMPKELWYRVAPLLCPRARPGRAMGAAERFRRQAASTGQRGNVTDPIGWVQLWTEGFLQWGLLAKCLSTEETATLMTGRDLC